MSAIDFTEKVSCRFSDWIDEITQVCSSRYWTDGHYWLADKLHFMLRRSSFLLRRRNTQNIL